MVSPIPLLAVWLLPLSWKVCRGEFLKTASVLMYTDKSIQQVLLSRRVTLYSLENNVFNLKVNNNLIKMYPIIHSFINCKVLAKKITAEDNLLITLYVLVWCHLPYVVYLTFGNRTQSFDWLLLGSVIKHNRTLPKILPIEHNRTFDEWKL